MKRILLGVLVSIATAFGQGGDPFEASVSRVEEEGRALVRLRVEVPSEHFIYAESLKVTTDSEALQTVNPPAPVVRPDPFSGEQKEVFEQNFTADYVWPKDRSGGMEVVLEYQGCSQSICFFPQRQVFTLEGPENVSYLTRPKADRDDQFPLMSGLTRAGSAGGYLNPEAFLAFLDTSLSGSAAADTGWAARFSDPVGTYQSVGLIWTVLLILIGGVALNLTPCVLPMIPVNLAVIGAGAQAGSRGRGFALGAVYGLGMAAAYGLLGLIVVVTGAQFGALNASPWFNAGVAVVFLVLALAMLGLFNIDFSRFQSGKAGGSEGRRFPLAFGMGMLAALLAGACVAPVLIFVLVLAGSFYADGAAVGLLLPFLLGLGMALPWPFAGAGLSVLPKPGRWMNVVKYAFASFIAAMAVYYGALAVKGWAGGGAQAAQEGELAAVKVTPETAETKLPELAAQAVAENKPVFIDFWATWCKNCLAMDKTTFRDEAVQARLDDFIVVKYQAEQPGNPLNRRLLTASDAVGLPAYVVLMPANATEPAP